jgi:hypothetical protein
MFRSIAVPVQNQPYEFLWDGTMTQLKKIIDCHYVRCLDIGGGYAICFNKDHELEEDPNYLATHIIPNICELIDYSAINGTVIIFRRDLHGYLIHHSIDMEIFRMATES